MLIIPATDIYKGKVARLLKGDFNKVTFYELPPIIYATEFEKIGSQWMHIVDLEASVDGLISTEKIISEIKKNTNLKIQFGGGIKSLDAADKIFSIGVDRIVIGSISITDKNEFLKIVDKYGPDKIVVATDSKNEIILVKGWMEESNTTLYDHIDYCIELGLKYFLSTDITKDGTLTGPNFGLYNKLLDKYPSSNFIASGGMSCIDDIKKLNETNIYAAVIGKAIYENKITLEELKSFVS